MKPKELLYSLDHVGEDLLAGAEQTILVRKHRPWAGVAAAALLIAAVGVGGFFLWKSLKGGISPAATGDDPSGPNTVTMPNIEPTENPGKLPLLTVGDSWTGLSRTRFDDLERSAAGSLTADYGNLTRLPVYEQDSSHRYTADQLQARLQKAADWLGATLSDEVGFGYAEESFFPECCSADTDQGTLTVWADGRISMLYNEEYAITSHAKASLAGGLTQEETQRALRDLCMEDCGAQLAERLGLGECGFVTCDRWDPTSSAWTVFTVYPLREDPAQQLVSRWFESVRLLTNDGRTLRGFELDRFPREDLDEAPEGLWLQGSYPVIAPGEATNGLDLGSFLCEEESIDRVSVYSNALCEQLVYLPEAGHDLLMPFYRFWVSADGAGADDEYIAVYVPAVRDTHLTDWELYRSMRLPSLAVGEVAGDEPALLLTDPEAYLASNPWREEERINALPVYKLPETGAQDAAMFFFAEEDRYTPDCGAGLEGSARSEELIRAFTAQVVAKAGLRSDWPWNVVEGEYPRTQTLAGVDGPLYAAEVYLATDYVGSRILNYNLQRITLWYRDGTLWGFSVPGYALSDSIWYDYFYAGTPKAEGPADSDVAETELPIGIPTDLTQVGLYPIISPAEARELAWAGKFAGAAAERPAGGLALLPTYFTSPEELMMDLVYLPNGDGTCLMPFYRFLFPIGGDVESGAEVCEAYYVPAVNELYLTDYPPEPDETEPVETEPNEIVPDETEPEPPTPTGGYLPAPVQTAEGQFEIQGLEGKTVKAMNYIGDCRDPVWADLDGDGEKELIYWCHGPTSGLFTVGICVYDLKDGWPILEAHMIYCLDWGEISLSEKNGSVFFHYTPHRWDAAQQTSVPQAEELWPVTLGKGGVVLNGGDLPEGAALWGGEEWSWYGSSFEALKAAVKDRCVFTHWAGLVWTESKETESGARQYVFAAVSENGVTVTGLLRYQQQPDGSWFCARQGLELIEAPEDPAALSGLTMEELEARFGPCHFDMGSGLCIPCWFTEDCQLLIVHPGYSVELRQLTALGS